MIKSINHSKLYAYFYKGTLKNMFLTVKYVDCSSLRDKVSMDIYNHDNHTNF